jgi:hypothetical protein
MSDNVERCVLEGYRGVWVIETDYDALRTELERVTQQRDEAVKALEMLSGHYEQFAMNREERGMWRSAYELIERIKGETT